MRAFVPRIFLVVAIVVLAVLPAAGQATAAQPGQAIGTLSAGGETVKLTHAAAFVDQKDSRKPVILLLTDQEVPAGTWKSEFDMRNYQKPTRSRVWDSTWTSRVKCFGGSTTSTSSRRR